MISTRDYLLTERERNILRAFLEEGVELDGFSVTALRLKRWKKKQVKEDLELMESALQKISPDAKGRPKATRERLKTVLPETPSAQREKKNQ